MAANTINNDREPYADLNLIAISQQLLLAAKTKEATDSIVNILQSIPLQSLTEQLINDDYKKAFWINLYNGYTQIILLKNPVQYKNRSAFFGNRQINLAGAKLSLDDIEHGILRRSKIKWGLGYFHKLFPGTFEQDYRVDTLDYRIHFSLNCGAKSCPPIAFYKPVELNRQLDLATRVYLSGEVEYDTVANTVALPALMGWFRGDFGGTKAITNLLKRLQIIPEGKRPAVKFKQYNWDLFLENYKAEYYDEQLLQC
jgi:hypothetical protein